MRIKKHALTALLLPLLIAGCTTSITNLTPQVASRNPNNTYPVEAAFKSTEQNLRWDTIQPSVVIGGDSYPMRPTPLMTNRWETLIPVPPDHNAVIYSIEFEYYKNAFGPAESDRRLSKRYRLQITDN
jgi:hypothetical protein